MRDPDRIPQIIELLQRAWQENPDWRLGQVIGNAIRPHFDPFHVEDGDMSLGLMSLLRIVVEPEDAR